MPPGDVHRPSRARIGWRAKVKTALNAASLFVMAPCAATVWLGHRLAGPNAGQGTFVFWTHVVSLLPGAPGRFLRRAFYRWTLERCDVDVTIEFGTLFSRRAAVLEEGVYIGCYALIGSACIGAHSLVGSRVSLLSGGAQHHWLPSGGWSETDVTCLTRVTIGPHTWIGEGAVLMAGTGEGCMVAAGAVVSAPVPANTMVAGNPARFVRRVTSQTAEVAAALPAAGEAEERVRGVS